MGVALPPLRLSGDVTGPFLATDDDVSRQAARIKFLFSKEQTQFIENGDLLMSKHHDFTQADAARASAQPGTMGALENLAGFAEDVNNQALEGLSDPAALEAAVLERFGPNTSVKDVTEALDALRDISLGL